MGDEDRELREEVMEGGRVISGMGWKMSALEGGRGVRRSASSSADSGFGGVGERAREDEERDRSDASSISTSFELRLVELASSDFVSLSGIGGRRLRFSTMILCKLTKMSILARGERI